MINNMPAWIAGFLLVFVGVFLALRSFMRPEDMIVILNGLFFGSVVALAVIMRKLGWNAFMGRLKYGDATVFTLGLCLVLAAVVMGVSSSVWLRATGVNVPSLTLTAFARYTVSVGFIVISYAPDFGLGLFDSRDRRLVLISVGVGIAVAASVILAQTYEVLA